MQRDSYNKTKIILVHGTWSPNAPWIQQDSPLQKAINLHCPDCEEPVQFIWSGNNSVEGRQAASYKLIDQIEEHSGQKHILIAHSHGGNVVLQALHGRTPEKPIQDSVSGVICLNTPFFTLLRKDTTHIVFFVVVSLIMFLSAAFSFPLFFRHELSYWPIYSIGALVVLYLIFSWLTVKNIESWIDRSWLNYKNKFQPPRIRAIPFLCLNSGADEAFTFLSVIDGISNIPSILFSRYGSQILLGTFAALLFLHKIAAYVDLFTLTWIKSINGSIFGFVLALFKLPDLRGWGFNLTPEWPIVAAFFEILGLSAIYAAMFAFAVTFLAITLGALSRATTGTWKEPLFPLFARQFITLTPTNCEKVEFYQYDASDDDTPLHSSLYSDPAAIGQIVKWINNLQQSSHKPNL